MLNLFPCHKFSSLHFHLGYLSLLCNLVFWLSDSLGGAHVQVNLVMSSVNWSVLGGVFTCTCSVTRESTSKQSASLYFLSTCSENSACLSGHWPCIHTTAWVYLLTSPLSCQTASTVSLVPFQISIPLMAWPISWLFLRWTWRFKPFKWIIL